MKDINPMITALKESIKRELGDNFDVERVLMANFEEMVYIIGKYQLDQFKSATENIQDIYKHINNLPLIQHAQEPLKKEIEELKKQVSKLLVYKNYVDVQKEIQNSSKTEGSLE